MCPCTRCMDKTFCIIIIQFAPMLLKSEEMILPEPSTKLKIWDLAYFGVSKKHQRKGIGRALIEDCERVVSVAIRHIREIPDSDMMCF